MTRRTPDQYNWSKLEFDETLLTKHFSPLGSRNILFVVVHHMTIVGSGNGDALTACYNTWQTRQASAHYGVDGGMVRQFVYDKDYAWACGDTYGNLHGLHIEHANSTAGPKWLVDNATILTGARLAANAHVLYKLGRPVDKRTLRQHDEFFATACPGPFLGGTEWAAYVKETQRVYDLLVATQEPTVPTPKPPAPTPVTVDTTEIFANLAGYDAVKGAKNRVARAKTIIPDYLLAKKPDWFHFQECAIDMWPELDKQLAGYKRVAEGGKGRESYFRQGNGITITEATLTNVSHMLAKDTKEILTIAWAKDGVPAVTANFHNENQGIVVQPLQLNDVMKTARKMADKHGIKPASILIGGDSNFPKVQTWIKNFTWWTEVGKSAIKKIDLQYKSTNGWIYNLATGARIDVALHYKAATILSAELLFGKLISDHWQLRVKRRLTK